MVPKEGTPTTLAQKYLNKQRGKIIQVPFTLRDHCPESYILWDKRQFQILILNLSLDSFFSQHWSLALSLLKR